MEGRKGGSVGQRVKGRHGEMWFGSVINSSVKGTSVAIPCNKSDTVGNVPLIILPCQVVATNMSDFNKHKVLDRVIERQEKTVQRKTRHFTKKQRQRQHQRKKLWRKVLWSSFFRKPPHTVERGFEVVSPGNREESCAVPPGRTMSA